MQRTIIKSVSNFYFGKIQEKKSENENNLSSPFCRLSFLCTEDLAVSFHLAENWIQAAAFMSNLSDHGRHDDTKQNISSLNVKQLGKF